MALRMTGEEFKAWLSARRWTVDKAAAEMQVNRRTVQRWKAKGLRGSAVRVVEMIPAPGEFE
jgi:predicted DNA-binding protein (UPF0251 family)